MTHRTARRGHGVLAALLVLMASGCGTSGAVAPPAPQPIVIGSEAPAVPPIVTWSEAPTPQSGPSTESPKAAPSPTSPAPSTSPRNVEKAPRTGTVLAQLATISVKGRAPQTGYEREMFGNGWKDPDHNGCDARNDILGRDLDSTTAKPGTQGCIVLSGVLEDPFTGRTIHFTRGQGTSTKVQIDHVVPLSDAWQKGAQQMGAEERVEFANDPLNLLAVDGPTNASKGDGDAATWLPPNRSFRCDYVARQTAIKAKYRLWMTRAEHDAIERMVIAECPAQKVPGG